MIYLWSLGEDIPVMGGPSELRLVLFSEALSAQFAVRLVGIDQEQVDDLLSFVRAHQESMGASAPAPSQPPRPAAPPIPPPSSPPPVPKPPPRPRPLSVEADEVEAVPPWMDFPLPPIEEME